MPCCEAWDGFLVKSRLPPGGLKSKELNSQPMGTLKVMGRKREGGCAHSDSVKPQQFLSLTEQVV